MDRNAGNKAGTAVWCLAAALVIGGCAQLTTSAEEKADLERVADTKGDSYIACVKNQAAEIYTTTDPAFIRDAVSSRCGTEREAFIAAKKKSLESKYMLTEKPLQESLDNLDDRARIELAETLLARPAAAGPGTQPAARSGSTAAVSAPVAAAAPVSAGAPASWDAQQRIYLDCMDDQAEKYASLDESAQAIAEVAVSRCSMYLGSESVVALEREGRAQVMGKVMDLRLQRAPGRR